jgi:hypothetical protein
MKRADESTTPLTGPARRSVLKSLGAAGVVAAASSLLPARAFGAAPSELAIDWSQIARVSKTTATLQVVVNALIRRESPIHDNVFNEIRALHADYVRFVPWYPYPRLGVAELEAPTSDSTSWDFTLIDPLVEDFLQATSGHSTIMNFSTIPEWMWQGGWSVQDGQLAALGGDNGVAKQGLDWTDYTFTADVTPLSTGNTGGHSYAQAGMLFRMNAAGAGYGFLLSNYPYTSPAAAGYVVFVPFGDNGAPGAVHATALPFAVVGGQTYRVGITVAGGTFTIAVNGITVDSVAVGSSAGTVGFREANAESARFDNVLVTAPDGTVLLSDDFSDGLDQWVGTSGWSASDGDLTVVGGNNGVAKDGLDWTDYTFAADVTPLATGPYAQAGLLFRMDSAGTGYGYLLSNFAYTSPAASGYVVFVPFVNGVAGAVQAKALPFAVVGGQTYHVAITVSGDTFTIAVNGTTVDTATASTVSAGTVGFREDSAESARFDNVLVTAPDGTVLLSDDFSDGLAQWVGPLVAPADPDAIDFTYSQGGQLVVPIQTVADYYGRLVSWYTQGGFTDELGTVHTSNHHFSFPYWEVLNELEHGLSPQLYTQLYDAIVTEIQKVSPQTKFVGLALGGLNATYVSYFLNPANHAAGVPVDLISYHFYASPSGSNPTTYGPAGFAQADSFLSQVDQIEAIRMQLAPQVRTTVDETGSILDIASTQLNPAPIPDAYWDFSGAIYAYVFANLALKGIDIVGESQMVGYPGQFPSVSMVDWNTGLPNARYRVLQLLLEEMPPGSNLVAPPPTPTGYFVLGYLNADQDVRKVLVVNKTDAPVSVPIPGLRNNARARVVDQTSAGGPIRTEAASGDQYTLGGYGVAVVTLRD